MAFTAQPTFPSEPYERKGSLSLRSNHMNYSRAILNSNWHQAREAEPKDYDINKGDVRDFSKATYRRIGNVTDGSLPRTTYQDQAQEIFLKKYFEPQEVKKPMVDQETLPNATLERETGLPKEGFGSALPHHHPDHDKLYLETTQQADFKPPYPYEPASNILKEDEVADNSKAFKRCISQFTDTADYRRPGRNTWQDESGIYANSHFKQQVPEYRKTQPIAERLV